MLECNRSSPGMIIPKNLKEPLINRSKSEIDSPNFVGRKRRLNGSIRSLKDYDTGCTWWKVVISLILFLAFLGVLDFIVQSGLEKQAKL